MTRDDLDRTIALANHCHLTGYDSGTEDCELCRQDMVGVSKAVVDFVTAWLEEHINVVIADVWREDMS